MIACPACGTLHVPGSTQCMKCGAAIPQAPAPAFGTRAGATPPAGGPPEVAPGGYGAPTGDAPAAGGVGGVPPGPGWGGAPAPQQGYGGAPPSGGGYGGEGYGGGGYPPGPAPGAPPTAPSGGGQRIDIGDIFQTSFELWRANLVPLVILFGGLAIPGSLITTVGSIIQGRALREAMSTGATPTDPFAMAGATFEGIGIIYFGFFVSMVLLTLAQGAASKIGLEMISGRSVPAPREALAFAMGRLFSLVIIGVLLSFGIGLGCLCFCVPGVLLALGTCVTFPVIIAEGKGAIDAAQRSWELTDGAKTEILLVGLAVVAMSIGVYLPFICLTWAIGGATPGGGSTIGIIFQSVVGLGLEAVVGSFFTMIPVVIYARRASFGTTTDASAVAQVFR